MKKYATALAGVALAVSLAGPALAKDKIIGVSWSNFQEERWKTDEAAIKKALEANGDKYISADAQSSASKQLTDVESLIAQGANALIILAQDSSAIGPAVEKAVAEGIPVVGYDRLIENKDAFYITFDNKEVGRMQARGVLAVKPEGNYAFIKGSSADPNADFLFSGAQEVLKDAIASGKIKNVGEAYTDGWLPANAQKNMEQFLTKNDNKIDAVVAANDGTAGGAIAALQAQGLAGTVPVSGQDADFAALNRIALGTQTVSVWKDSRELGKQPVSLRHSPTARRWATFRMCRSLPAVRTRLKSMPCS
jgi:D-xylose transport system substrate-binding protein